MSKSLIKKFGITLLLLLGMGNTMRAQASNVAVQIISPKANQEICSPTTLPISARFTNRDTVPRKLVTSIMIENILTHYIAYAQVDTIPNVPSGGSVNPTYAPYITNPMMLYQLGTFLINATVSALDSSNQQIKNWSFADSSSLHIFEIRTTATPFIDVSDGYGVTSHVLIPDQTKWVSSGTTIEDGSSVAWDPPPPRYSDESGGVGSRGLLGPVYRFDRSDTVKNLYTGTGVGDTLTSFVFNLKEQTKVVLTFDFMRGGRLPYPGFWDADTMSGPENTILNNKGEVIRAGDSLIIEFKDTAEPVCNPVVWNRIAAIDGGHDFEFKTFWLMLNTFGPSPTITYHITGDSKSVTVPAKNYLDSGFRFRLRLKANNNGSGKIIDDDDPWYIDNIGLEVPRLPEIEVSWVRIVTPYTKIPFSAATNIPVYFSIRNYSVDAAVPIPIAVWIINRNGEIVYNDTIEVADLREGKDSVIRMPDWNAQGLTGIPIDSQYRILAGIADLFYDDYTQDNQTFSEFYFRCDPSPDAIQEFAYDDAGMKTIRGSGNDIPFINNISGEGIGFNSTSGSYAIKFILPHSDTIYGARIYFGSANQSPDPISISLLQEDSNSCVPGNALNLPGIVTTIRQGGLFDQFWPYTFPKPIAVPAGVYWLSVSQLAQNSFMMGGDLSRGGGEITINDGIDPHIAPLYSDKYGTQWSPDHNNADISCAFAVEVPAGSGLWNEWMPTEGFWPSNTVGNAHQSITWNPQLSSPFILGGSYLPMIRVIAGNLSITKSEVGQKNTNYSGFEMYPNLKLLFNPITSSADFQFDALQEPAVFELFDALGRSLLRQQLAVGQQTRRVDMQKYPAGIYFARLGGETVRFVSIKN